ncbi:MAG: hypothetical protein R2854_12025 [Caldilineaceae bacterium]
MGRRREPGAFVHDGAGNVYTARAEAHQDTTLNPPAEQNKVYKVDSAGGVMTEFVDLSPAGPMTENNPFGVLGLFYDCDTDSLYAGSVAGSTPTEEVGRIFRIDAATGEVDTLENVDAMGVGVFNMPDGGKTTRLFGSGRDTGIRSIALMKTATLWGSREEFFLAQFEGSANDKGQRITFTNENQMVIKGIDFNPLALRAASEPRRNLYTFALNPESQTWELQSIEADPV